MKTLKKSLSLVLVLAMVLSLGAFSAFAKTSKDYTDADAITYKEAVDVMTYLGVIEGMENGSFDPTGTFTREQAAKIIACMMLGSDNAEALSVGRAPFSDVAADRWSAGYIAYCVQEGILAGVGNGKFDPTGTLTSYAWAKMLLCALGYDAGTEGLVGDAWQTNTVRLAVKSGMLSNSQFNLTFNREAAVLYAFNCLTTDMVEYPQGKVTVTTSDATVEVAGSLAYSVDNKGNDPDYDNSEDGILQFCEMYFEDLTLTDTGDDDFARPVNDWKYDNKAIGSYAKTPKASYTAEVKAKTIYTDLGLSDTDYFDTYIDGMGDEDSGSGYEAYEITKISRSDNDPICYTNSNGNKVEPTGNGVLTEVYKIGSGKNATYRIVIVNTYVGKVTKVNSSDETITVSSQSSENSAKGEAEVDNTSDFARNDIVIYNWSRAVYEGDSDAKDAIQNVKVAEISEQLYVTKITTNKSFVSDGETYSYAKKASTSSKGEAEYKGEVDAYFDNYGYVIYAEKYSSGASNYVYVLTAGAAGLDDRARVVGSEGVRETVDTDDTYNSLIGQIVRYSTDSANVYTLKSLGAARHVEDKVGDTSTITIDKGKANMTLNDGSGAQTFTATSSTVYVVQTDTNKFSVYTGYRNVPSITGSGTTNKPIVWAVALDSSGRVEMVFIGNNARISGTANNVLIIDRGNRDGQWDSQYNDYYYEVYAVVDGVAGTYKVSADDYDEYVNTAASIVDKEGKSYGGTPYKYGTILLESVSTSGDGKILGFDASDILATEYNSGGTATLISSTSTDGTYFGYGVKLDDGIVTINRSNSTSNSVDFAISEKAVIVWVKADGKDYDDGYTVSDDFEYSYDSTAKDYVITFVTIDDDDEITEIYILAQ